MLPVLAQFKPLTPLYDESQLGLKSFLNLTPGTARQPGSQYPVERRREIDQAIREAWSWLEKAKRLTISAKLPRQSPAPRSRALSFSTSTGPILGWIGCSGS